jgi:hypothetical protein
MAVRELARTGSVISGADIAQAVRQLPPHRRLELVVVIGDELENPARAGIHAQAAAVAPVGVDGDVVLA